MFTSSIISAGLSVLSKLSAYFRCSADEGGLLLQLAGGLMVACPRPGQLANVTACLTGPGLTVHGRLVCPDCRTYCEGILVQLG
ncbi:unnamed protein product [Protopolystoma xenopodis]|uniref:Uncharacterized protein n=1 Tax=Protopolystoma xenopodis TaxID=117903 RepID=A0A448XDY8_9PLAT|nr:unnamed protein product [Protopolystoma xenopodis]